MLSIKNLTKRFGHKTILDNISLEVKKGSIAVLLGTSGVGKSTLLRILNNLESYDEGSILLDEKKLDPKTVSTSHTCGMVFQQFNLFDHLTNLENITLALENSKGKSHKDADTIARMLLEHYGLIDKANAYPAELSGGQKQRLAIARTIAMQPKIICFDEPTSALDPLLTNQIAKTLNELAQQGYIILVATHDTALVDKLDADIYLMDKGAIVEKASSNEFRQNPSAFERIKRFIKGN